MIQARVVEEGAEGRANNPPLDGLEPEVLSEIAGGSGVSIAELGVILAALLAGPDAGVDSGVDSGSLDSESLWKRVAELTWGAELAGGAEPAPGADHQ